MVDIPYEQPRGPSVFQLLGWLLVALMLIVTVFIGVAANESFDHAREVRAKMEEKPRVPAEVARRPQSAREEVSISLDWETKRLILIFFGVAYVVAEILMLAWVARDANSRGVDGGAVWVITILITGFFGLLVYLASRPHGMLVVCSRCYNKKLQYAKLCPHCGHRS